MAAPVKNAKVHSSIFTVHYDSIAVDKSVEEIRENYDPAVLDAMAQTIKANGILEPLKVRKAKLGEDKLKVYIVNGHHRYFATQIAIDKYKADPKLKENIKVVFEEEGTNEESRGISLVLLNSSKPLSPLEQARVVEQLIKYGMKKAEIAASLGKSQKEITRLIELNETPVVVRQAVQNNIISPTAAIELSKSNEKVQQKIITKIEGLLDKAKTLGEAKIEATEPTDKPQGKKAKPTKKVSPAIKVKDIQKEAGKQTSYSVTEIKELRSKVQKIWRDTQEHPAKEFWEATLYGVNLVLGEELKVGRFDDMAI
jgi:ParB/RepB/Spo0J family partition protein